METWLRHKISNQDAHLGIVRLHVAIYRRLWILLKLRGLRMMVMGTVRYRFHLLLTINL